MVVERSPIFSRTMSQQSEEFEDVEDLEDLDPVDTLKTSRPPKQNNNKEADDAQHDDASFYAELLEAFNETRAELKRQRLVIQTLNTSLTALERRDPGPASQQSSREPKVKMPDIFDGKVSEYNTFISQCLLIFRMHPIIYDDDDKDLDKIFFIISYLGGIPRKWAIPILENENHSLRKNFKTFKTALDTIYTDRNLKQKVRDKLGLLKQTKSIASYSAEFQQIIASLDLKDDDDSKLSLFYTSLDQIIKDQLIYFSQTKTFTELLDQCIIIDQRNYAHRKAKQSAEKPSKPQQPNAPSKFNNNNSNNSKKPNYPNSSDKPTHSSNSNSNSGSSFSFDAKRKYPNFHRESLSEEEKKRRRDNNLCGYCGSSEHFIDACPRKSQTATNIQPRPSIPDPSNPAPEYSNPKLPPGK